MDADYDVAYLTHALADLRVMPLGRLRSDRVMLRDPGPARSGPKGGRPRRHGGVLTFAKPDSWHQPDLTTATHTTRYGTAEATAWDRMHPRPTHRGPLAGPRQRRTAHPARHIDPPPGRAPAGRPRPETGLAVVLRHRRNTGGRGPLVAVLPPQIRPGSHLEAPEADARLDGIEDPPRRQRRSVDLAHHRRPHPAPPRPPPRRGPAPSLGATRRTPPPHPRPRPPGVSQHPRDGGPSVGRTETVQAGPGTTSRLEEQAARHTSRRRQNGQTCRIDQGIPSPPRINAKLSGACRRGRWTCRRGPAVRRRTGPRWRRAGRPR